MEDDMDVSIIIISYNTKKLTLQAIKSVFEEGSDLRKEIIVVDNASSDGSVAAIQKLQSSNSNFLIKLIENKSNLGFSKANNQGIKIARGDYIFLLNSDTKVKKGSIGSLLSFAKRKSDAGVVGPSLLNADGSKQPSCLHFPNIRNAVLEYWFGKSGLFDKYVPKGNMPQEVDAVVGAAFLITPRALKKVGLLDERYFFYFEDIDYCRRVYQKNLKVYFFPDSEVVHYHGASGKKLADKTNQWRRLVPSSKIYHGTLKHYLLTFALWLGQKWRKLVG